MFYVRLALLALLTFHTGLAFAQEKLRVVASFSILADFVHQVAGDRVALTTLVGPDGDAHVFQPTPSDAKSLAQAELIFVNGLKFEGWMDRLMQASGARAPVVTASKGISPLVRSGANADPHAWQDMANAKIYVVNIRDALTAADPQGRPDFEANAAAYIAKLDALEAKVRAAVAAIPADRRKIITTHDAFGYFGRAYGMSFIAPQNVSTEAEASAKDVAKIIKQIRAQKIPAVFLENITDNRLIERIAAESGARIGGKVWSDALSPADGPAATYLDMMANNIRAFSAALLM